MKYCVIKNTTKIIDGSENPIEIMLKNALNSGFKESEIEVLTEEEYKERKEPTPEPQPTEMELLKEKVQTQEILINELLTEIIPNITGGN